MSKREKISDKICRIATWVALLAPPAINTIAIHDNYRIKPSTAYQHAAPNTLRHMQDKIDVQNRKLEQKAEDIYKTIKPNHRTA